jgi:serine/threonine protein kinase
MRESADSLLYLQQAGFELFDMQHAFGRSDQIRTSKVMKVNGKLRTFVLEYAPPEILTLAKKNIKLSIEKINVYDWAIKVYSLIFNKSSEELITDNEKYKFTTERAYRPYIRSIRDRLDDLSQPMKDFINPLLLQALQYDPKERPTIKDLVKELKLHIKSNKTATKLIEDIKEKMMLGESDFKEEEVREESVVKKGDKVLVVDAIKKDKEVVLECGHEVGKSQLVEFILNEFVGNRMYGHRCVCPECNELKVLS